MHDFMPLGPVATGSHAQGAEARSMDQCPALAQRSLREPYEPSARAANHCVYPAPDHVRAATISHKK